MVLLVMITVVVVVVVVVVAIIVIIIIVTVIVVMIGQSAPSTSRSCRLSRCGIDTAGEKTTHTSALRLS